MMLWNVEEINKEAQVIADDQPSIEDERTARMGYENVYTGPYTGPTTVRRFLVVHEGIRSSYCL